MATYPGGIPSLTRPAAGNPANDGSATDATVVVDAMSDEIEAIATELGVNPSGGSATVVARLDALDSTVSGKAASSHTHTASDVSDFAETVRDTIGSALVAGTNVTITVNDGADTITIDAAGGGGLTEEQTEDIVNGLLVAGANISLTYDDVANTLTVAVTGLGTAAALSTADIDERARDAVGTALTAGTGITVTPNDGADTITVATSALLPTLADAKGDLLVATAADTVGRLAVGTNGHVLTADSTQSAGVKWAAASGGGTDIYAVSVGEYAQPIGYGDATAFGTQSRMYLIPFTVSTSSTFSSALVYVDTEAASAVVRMGVYSGLGTSGVLIADWGTVSAGTGTAGTQVSVSFTWSPSAGTYYLACVIQTAAAKLRSNYLMSPVQRLTDPAAYPNAFAYYQAGVTGALPTNNISAATNYTAQVPVVRLYRSA